jgi:hypothetical protein
MLLDIAPAVTVFRRLERLCACGAVLRTRSTRDRRVHELRLSPDVHRMFGLFLGSDGETRLLRTVPAPGAPGGIKMRA